MSTEMIEILQESVARMNAQCDYADLYISSGVSHSVAFEDGKIDEVSSFRSDGAGARAVRADNTIYAYCPGSSGEAAATALSKAAASASCSSVMPGDIRQGLGSVVILENQPGPVSFDTFADVDKELRAESKYVRQVTLASRTSAKSIMIVRGDGSVVLDDRRYTGFTVNIVVEKDGVLQTAYERLWKLASPEAFWGEDESPRSIARAAFERAMLMLDAVPCPAGRMPVLLDGVSGGTMVHEACGHGLEADIIQKDFSVYRDKMGELVASPLISIVDDASMPGKYGSYAYDDEGTPSRRNVLIENGVLKGYLTDILSSRAGDLPLSGNGRRESYLHQPIPRMSNTYVLPGTSEPGTLLDGMKSGLLVKKMGGGEVNPTSGDFVFNITEGYIVENGKIGRPVRGATLTGNGPEALMNIVAVGNDLSFDPGTCGKSGQGVPVTDGQPSLLVENLTVGGCDTGDVC